MAKQSKKKIDWDLPENKIKKQNAFRLYAAGRGTKEIMKAMGITSYPILSRFIHSEKWEDHAKTWQENPDQENHYPWEIERPSKLVPVPPKMEAMAKEKRLQCIKAFSMFCSGKTMADISDELGVGYSTIKLWSETQRWKICRERLANENSPAPWENDDVPTLLSDITASIETMKKSIKFLTGKVLVKAADAAQDLDGMEALGMMRNIKQLAEAAAINFSDGKNQQNAVQINIATKLESVKIPENNTYEAELVINE
jgi:DNA-binding CsgD family transcriptional regulator